MSNSDIHASRAAFKRAMALSWITAQRPDILAVIEAETDKKFPLPPNKKSRRDWQMPETLANLE